MSQEGYLMLNTKTMMDEISETYSSYRIPDNIQTDVKNFIETDVKYAIGRNEYSKKLCETIGLDYIVDDYTDEKVFHNTKVIKFEDLPKGAHVANCVTNARYTMIHEKLMNAGMLPVGYLDICNCIPQVIEHPYWVLDTRYEMKHNPQRLQNIFDDLVDEESVKTLRDVLLFRLTGDRTFLSNYEVKLEEQYFEDFLDLNSIEVFVDCGGFDGETTKIFTKKCPNYKKVYFFEPSLKNLNVAKQNLKTVENVDFINKGVSDRDETLRFNASLGSGSNIAPDGEETVDVVKIDNYLKDKNALLKMDLEGWEMNALRGAEKSIKEFRPNLAICIYHKASDFYEVHEYVKKITDQYKNIYVRHYSQGWNETVMYFTF